jgi:hypothetical protein
VVVEVVADVDGSVSLFILRWSVTGVRLFASLLWVLLLLDQRSI